MQLYAITDRRLLAPEHPGVSPTALDAPSFAGAKLTARVGETAAILELARHWAARGIDYIQIREKDLAPGGLSELTRSIVNTVRPQNTCTRVLLNGPAEIALEAGADGVHFPADAPLSSAAEARKLFARAGKDAILSHSCHSVKEVLKIREESQRNPRATTANTLILYAPVFEKAIAGGKLPGVGLESLRSAVYAAKNIPVFALGGVTSENAPACLEAGATGVAGIRLFLEPIP